MPVTLPTRSPQAAGDRAYQDAALSMKEIGVEVSPPSTDAMALEGLALRRGLQVLEIGSGSGFTTALLAFIVGSEGHVTGVEVGGNWRYLCCPPCAASA